MRQLVTQQPDANFKPAIRWMLTLSSVAMIIFAGLTFAKVLPLPGYIGGLFLAVAAIDLIIGYVVFRD